MKLIELQVIPTKDHKSCIVNLSFDPADGIFRSRYITLNYDPDNDLQVTCVPPNLENEILQQATDYARRIITAICNALHTIGTISGEPS